VPVTCPCHKELDGLFDRALAKDPEARPPDIETWAMELADALDQVRIDRPAWRIEGDPDAASASDDGETALSS